MTTTLDPTSRHSAVTPVTASFGAEIGGVDLAGDLDDATLGWIRSTLLEWGVLFFRDQRLEAAGQAAFARRFGPLTAGHPTIPAPDGLPLVLDLDSLAGGRANHWHTDVTFADRPPAISVLRAVRLPDRGGDTMWASTALGYDRLPRPFKVLADGFRAVHTNAHDYGRVQWDEDDEVLRRHREQFTSIHFETEHPVVRAHPETGRKTLLLGGFARRIVGLSSSESLDLLRIFQGYVLQPEHLVRWRWRPGDVAVWDNRQTQHYAVNDYGDRHRQMQRVTVAGDRPVGLDGRPSVALKGDAGAYTDFEA